MEIKNVRAVSYIRVSSTWLFIVNLKKKKKNPKMTHITPDLYSQEFLESKRRFYFLKFFALNSKLSNILF